MTLSAEQLMKGCNFGEARYILGDGPRPQVALLVRERSAMIRYLGDTTVQVLSGLFLEGECLVVVVLLRAGRHVRQIYPVWWNYHAADGAKVFRLMQGQGILAVNFYGDGARRERSFVLENPLADFFRFAEQQATRLPAWNSGQFDHFRREACARAGSVDGLWDELAGKGTPWEDEA